MKDNTSEELKAALRRWLLSNMGERPRVLDCFSGIERRMYHTCYSALSYTSVDQKKDAGADYEVDSRLFLRSCDLSHWNLFDLDAYGCPWHHFMILCARRPPGPFGVALTEGLRYNADMNSLPLPLRSLAGIPRRMSIPGLGRHLATIRALVLTNCARRFGVILRVGRQARAGDMWYGAGVFEKVGKIGNAKMTTGVQ